MGAFLLCFEDFAEAHLYFQDFTLPPESEVQT